MVPREVLNFHFGMSVLLERPKIGAQKTDCHQIWGLTELIFFPYLRLLELKFDQILGVRTEHFPDFETLKCNFSKRL